MNPKILLGSIGAVVILILVSFTNVVGIQSTTSDSVKNSPLFEYRTKKAIHETFTTCHYQYISMNNLLNIPLSTPDQRVQFVMRFVQIIVQMDETSFNTLIAYCVNHFNQNNKVKHTNIAEIITGLKTIRKNPEYIVHQIVTNSRAINNNYDVSQQYTINGDWIPGCLLAAIFYMLFIYPVLLAVTSIFIIISARNDCFYSIGTGCNACPCYRVQVNRYLYELDKI
jgi:hypothetical protein